MDECRKQNIRLVGHADSRFVGLARALQAGQQSEHLDGYLEAILRDDAPMKGSVSDSYIYQPKNWASLDYVDESKTPALSDSRASTSYNTNSVRKLPPVKRRKARMRLGSWRTTSATHGVACSSAIRQLHKWLPAPPAPGASLCPPRVGTKTQVRCPS